MFAKMVCSNICFYNRRDTWVNKNSNTSIHEEQFPSLPSQWKNKDIFQKWQKLFEIKQQANVAIEEKKSK